MRGPKPPAVTLTTAARRDLEALAGAHRTPQQVALRARIVLAAAGERVISTDELTGVQALERKHPGLPLAPGKVERREFEYVRRHRHLPAQPRRRQRPGAGPVPRLDPHRGGFRGPHPADRRD